MKITCTQENLKKAIFSVERVVGKKSTLPILENILFEVKNGLVFVSATNLELGVVVQLSAKIEREGRITVPVKVLGLFVGNLGSDAVIDISVQGFEMHISSENHTAVIQGFDSEEFPLIPTVSEERYVFSLKARDFRENLQKNMFAVSPTNIRVEFSGVFLFFQEKLLAMASTDSFRLVETQIPFENGVSEEGQKVILPHQTVSEVIRLISDDVKEVRIAIQEGQIFFHIGTGVFLVSRIIQGSFPDYKQIIPTSFATTLEIPKDPLLQSLRLALAFLGGFVGEVIFSVDNEKNQLTLYTESEKTGKNTSVIPVEVSGNAISIVFNPKYVLDALQVVEGEQVTLSLNSESSPTVFSPREKGSGNATYQYVLMPIKK